MIVRKGQNRQLHKERARAKSKKLITLVEHGFAGRLLYEADWNPHPVYKEILGMDDEEYNVLIELKRKEMGNLKR